MSQKIAISCSAMGKLLFLIDGFVVIIILSDFAEFSLLFLPFYFIELTLHTNPVRIPVLIAGMALVGWLAAVILNYAPEARGGGIPTAITILRGIVPFHWIKSILSVFGSAMLTYFCGVPLGNEGPSVQMGTAVGRGTVALFAKNIQHGIAIS